MANPSGCRRTGVLLRRFDLTWICWHSNNIRRWQLQQLGNVLKNVDDACWSEDPRMLSNALENTALAWLNNLHDSLRLWHDAVSAGSHAAPHKV